MQFLSHSLFFITLTLLIETGYLFCSQSMLVAQSCPTLCTPWTVARQAPLSMECPMQEYWSGLPSPSAGDLPTPGIKPGSPTLLVDSLPPESPGKLERLPQFEFFWCFLVIRFNRFSCRTRLCFRSWVMLQISSPRVLIPQLRLKLQPPFLEHGILME